MMLMALVVAAPVTVLGSAADLPPWLTTVASVIAALVASRFWLIREQKRLEAATATKTVSEGVKLDAEVDKIRQELQGQALQWAQAQQSQMEAALAKKDIRIAELEARVESARAEGAKKDTKIQHLQHAIELLHDEVATLRAQVNPHAGRRHGDPQ